VYYRMVTSWDLTLGRRCTTVLTSVLAGTAGSWIFSLTLRGHVSGCFVEKTVRCRAVVTIRERQIYQDLG
jgi:hypothetical protein